MQGYIICDISEGKETRITQISLQSDFWLERTPGPRNTMVFIWFMARNPQPIPKEIMEKLTIAGTSYQINQELSRRGALQGWAIPGFVQQVI